MAKDKSKPKSLKGSSDKGKAFESKSQSRPQPAAKEPEPSVQSDTLEDDSVDERGDGVDEEGLERLMAALGEDGLDDFAKAHLELEDGSEDDDEEASGDESGDEDSEAAEGEDSEAESESGSESGDGEDDEEETIFTSKLGGEEDDDDEEGASEDEDMLDDDEDDVVDEDDPEFEERRAKNNAIAMKRIRQLIQLDPSLPWTETLVTTYPQTLEDVKADDDLNRELAFYKQALHCAQESRKLADQHSLPFTRPHDYFAEMVKSDIHMERIRTRLLDESAQIKRSEEAKKQRDLKKYGKQVHAERIKERAKAKKDMLDQVQSLKRKRAGNMDSLNDDDFEVGVDDDDERPSKRSAPSGGRDRGRGRGRGRGKDGAPRMSRDARDKKYQWGAPGGRHNKSNTRESTDNYEFGRGRGGGRGGRGGGKAGRGGASSRGRGTKRLGKSRRQAK